MSAESHNDGTPAEVVIARLEAKLQSALDKRGLRRCQNCQLGILRPDVRDVTVARHGRSIVVPKIHGHFCARCGEIEFDDNTDSAKRYATAGDKLVFRHHAADMWKTLNPAYSRPEKTYIKSLWHASFHAWSSYFAPLRMVAWLLDPAITKSLEQTKTPNRHDLPPLVTASWDAEASVWVATSDDVPGLVAEAATVEGLETKLKTLILELLAANKVQLQSARFQLSFSREVPLFPKDTPAYPLDDGPLSEKFVEGLRADVEANFPRGVSINRKDLFK